MYANLMSCFRENPVEIVGVLIPETIDLPPRQKFNIKNKSRFTFLDLLTGEGHSN